MLSKRFILLLSLTVAIAASIACAQNWRSFTSMCDPWDIEYAEGAVWGATEGGVFRFDLQDSTFELFTRADGLLGTKFYCLDIDSAGNVWCSGQGAALNIIGQNGSVTNITDLVRNDLSIRDIAVTGNTVFAGADDGIYEFYYDAALDDYFIRGGYHHLGTFPANTQVNAVYVYDGYLWAAADIGVTRIPADLPNKQPSQNWENFSASQGLSGNNTIGFTVLRDTLYAASKNSGIAWFDGENFHSVYVSISKREVKTFNDTIYAATADGVNRFTGSAWEPVGGNIGECHTLTMTPQGNLFAGKSCPAGSRGGLRGFDGMQWREFTLNAPAGKEVRGIMVDSQNRVWCAGASSTARGVYIYDGLHWTNITNQDSAYRDTLFFRNGLPQSLLEYPNGEVWAGSFGGGIAIFEPDDDISYITPYDPVPRIYSTSITGDYTVIGDMLLDSEDNIWMINRESHIHSPLLMAPRDYAVSHHDSVAWIEFTESNLYPSNSLLDYLVMDRQGRLWMAGDANAAPGIICLDFNGTPALKSDDQVYRFTASGDFGLFSNTIYDLAVDQDNRLWVVTGTGVNSFDIPDNLTGYTGYDFDYVYDLYGKRMSCVTVDPMNNKWFGTEEEGVIVLGADNYTILYVYSQENSPLLSNNIETITIHPGTGEAWIATSEGVSVVETPYRGYGEHLTVVELYPSPFRPPLDDRARFAGGSLTQNVSSVKIFTLNGFLVRKLSLSEAALGWNGRDDDGDFVGSGVYLVHVITEGGDTALGKIAVIRTR